MAKERYVNTAFWTDDYTDTLEPLERLLYLCLFTNPDTNIAGVYEIQLSQLRFYTGMNKDEILKGLKKFENDKKVYYRNGWMIVCNMPKRQQYWKRSKIKAGIIKILTSKEFSEPVEFIKSNNIPYTYPIDTLSISYQYPIDTISNNLDSDSDIDSDSLSESKFIGEDPPDVTEEITQDVQNLWITTYGKNPNAKPMRDFAQKLLDTFGWDKSKRLMYDFARKGFNLVETMDNSLDWQSGEIKPRGPTNGDKVLSTPARFNQKCEYEQCEKKATMKLEKHSVCSFDHFEKIKEAIKIPQ